MSGVQSSRAKAEAGKAHLFVENGDQEQKSRFLEYAPADGISHCLCPVEFGTSGSSSLLDKST
jgi:hypothetical protein